MNHKFRRDAVGLHIKEITFFVAGKDGSRAAGRIAMAKTVGATPLSISSAGSMLGMSSSTPGGHFSRHKSAARLAILVGYIINPFKVMGGVFIAYGDEAQIRGERRFRELLNAQIINLNFKAINHLVSFSRLIPAAPEFNIALEQGLQSTARGRFRMIGHDQKPLFERV